MSMFRRNTGHKKSPVDHLGVVPATPVERPERIEKVPADYTTGSVVRAILMMGGPSMIGFMATHVYGMVDTWWVAQLPGSESAVAALTIFNNILWFVGSINMMIGSGSVAIISRRYGEKKFEETERSIRETFTLKFAVGVVFGAIGLFFLKDLIYLAGGREQSLELAIQYGQVMFWGMPFAFVAFSVYTAMRSVSNPHMAMTIMLSSTCLNIILDPLLIFGYAGFPELGIRGAAVASIISYAMVCVIGIFMFIVGKTNVRMRLFTNTKMRVSSMWSMLKIGLPAWIAAASDSGLRLALTPVIAYFGERTLAAYGIAWQALTVGLVIVAGAGLGLSSLIGQTIGAGKIERAKETAHRALGLTAVVMTILGIALYAFARNFAELYFSDPETIEATVTVMRIVAFGFPFWGLWIMLEGLFSGVGMNKPTMIVSLLHSWALQAPLAYILVFVAGAGSTAVWWGITIVAAVASLAFLIYFRRGSWLTAQV